ncbi:MAG TPA: anti-sigma factor antagonist [Acidimicrobiales bacterium]|nr:anti-sigma factor antagonist [Acidimicrobiales bacterium]
MDEPMDLPLMIASATNVVIRVELTPGQALVGVSGEIDLVTAPDLAAVLDAVIGRGHQRVALDLSEIAFLDAQGLRVILEAHERLRPHGRLTISGTTPIVRRLMEVTGLDRTLDVLDPGPQGTPAGALDALSSVFGAATTQEVVEAALALLADAAVTALEPAAGASVTLRRHGQLVTVAASDHAVTDIDRHQYLTGEGPCVEAATRGEQCEASDLTAESRWPTFAQRCRQERIDAVVSSPLIVDGQPLGALNVYCRTARALSTDERLRASRLAALAAAALGRAAVATNTSSQMEKALESRDTIARATGVLMARDGLDPDEAFALMRRIAVRDDRSIHDVAADIITSTRTDRGPRPADH